MKTTQIALILVLIVLAGIGYYLIGIPIPEIVTTTTIPLTTTTSPIIPTTTIPVTTTPVTTTVTTTTQVTTTAPIAAEGILVMKIKDKLDLTNVTAINITIDKVEVHKAGVDEDETPSNETFETNDTSTAGWETVVDETKSYNLLELVDTPGEVMGEKTLSAGKYTQIRLSVSKTELTLENETYDVKVPSKRFYWIHPFNIESGGTTTLTLDFDADDSIKETGKNEFMLKPVVKIISEITVTTTTPATTSSTTTTTTVPTIDINLTLNGTQGDFYYQNETYANFTVTANANVLANLTTNMTEWTDKSSITPFYEYPHITCDVNDTWYNVTAFTGNNSWKYDYETHYAICYVTSSTITTVP